MVSLFIDQNTTVYFDSFGNKYIPPEVLNKIRYKWITQNLFRIQDDESIMFGFLLYCFHRIYLQESLLDYTNLCSPNDYKKNDNRIYKYYKDKYGRRSKS